MHNATATTCMEGELRTAVSEEHPRTPALEEIAGLNPFSSGGSESECSALTGVGATYEEASYDAEDRGRMTDDESYSPPYPAKAVKREAKVKDEEAEPIFATHKLNRPGRQPADAQRTPPPGETFSSPNRPHGTSPLQPISTAIADLEDLADQVGELASDSASDGAPRRDPSESMRKWRGPSPTPTPNEKEERARQHWAGNMWPSCFLLKGHSDLRDIDKMEMAAVPAA